MKFIACVWDTRECCCCLVLVCRRARSSLVQGHNVQSQSRNTHRWSVQGSLLVHCDWDVSWTVIAKSFSLSVRYLWHIKVLQCWHIVCARLKKGFIITCDTSEYYFQVPLISAALAWVRIRSSESEWRWREEGETKKCLSTAGIKFTCGWYSSASKRSRRSCSTKSCRWAHSRGGQYAQ